MRTCHGCARTIFWETKNGKRRLTISVVAALGNLAGRSGRAFTAASGRPYADRSRTYGGHIKTAWKTAIRKAGLDPELTPHEADTDVSQSFAEAFYEQESGWT